MAVLLVRAVLQVLDADVRHGQLTFDGELALVTLAPEKHCTTAHKASATGGGGGTARNRRVCDCSNGAFVRSGTRQWRRQRAP